METQTVTHATEAGNAVTRLAVFAPTWLGDAVMALPALADVRRALSDAAISIVARPSVAPLFALVPGLDDVVVLPAGGAGRRGGLADLRRRRCDAALLLPNSFQSALAAWRAGIPERWGYRADWRSPLLTRSVARPLRAHQAEYYQTLSAALGFARGPTEPRLTVDAGTRAAARRMLAAAGWDEATPLVACAPGAAFGSAKRWPAESFAAVAVRLAAEGAGTVFVGSAADRDVVNRVKAAVGASSTRVAPTPLDLVGQTDVPALAGVLANCRALVTNDSGAMHVAAALGLPVVAMFGPTNEAETPPLGAVAPVILTHHVWCRPCMLRECPLVHRCMTGISVDSVVAATRRFLDSRPV